MNDDGASHKQYMDPGPRLCYEADTCCHSNDDCIETGCTHYENRCTISWIAVIDSEEKHDHTIYQSKEHCLGNDWNRHVDLQKGLSDTGYQVPR